jgi:hypothetical protein
MRLRDHEIDVVVKEVLEVMRRGGHLKLLATEGEFQERVRKAMVEDLMVEENLNREVEEILKQHLKDVKNGAVDYRKMFAMIKNKLAKDRGLIIS